MIQTLNEDAQVALLLCTSLALPGPEAQSVLKPLRTAEWNGLVRRLLSSSLSGPSGLLRLSQDQMRTVLGIAETDAERLTKSVADIVSDITPATATPTISLE